MEELVRGPGGAMYLPPAMPQTAYRTFGLAAPLATHFVPARCAEVACPDYLNGWRVRVEHLSPELLHIARTSGRKFTEMRVAEGETWLVFEAGQNCFKVSTHRRRLEREPRFYMRGGDWRGDPDGNRPTEVSDVSWLDDFGEHQERLANVFEKG